MAALWPHRFRGWWGHPFALLPTGIGGPPGGGGPTGPTKTAPIQRDGEHQTVHPTYLSISL